MKDIQLVHKKILWEKSKVIYKYSPDENFQKDWEIKAGEWTYKDGYLIGKEDGNKGGILWFKKKFDKPVMICFTASTVEPCTRDVNAVFCASWDDEINDLGTSYVCGLNGWFADKAGIERSAGKGVQVFRSLTSSYKYTPGKEVRMIAGAVEGHSFMVVDGEIVAEHIEYKDYLEGGHIGFSPYCTILKIKDIEIREIAWEKCYEYYEPEF